MTGLHDLNLAGNNFSGSVPTCVSNISSLSSLDISQNHFSGPLPKNLPDSIEKFNASYNDLSGVVPENLRKFPLSSFFPGNSDLQFPNPPSGSTPKAGIGHSKPIKIIVKVLVIIACVIAVILLILLAIFIRYICISRRSRQQSFTSKNIHRQVQHNPSGLGGRVGGGGLVVSAEDLMTSQKRQSSEVISPDEKMAVITGFSPSKKSHLSWSSESGDSPSIFLMIQFHSYLKNYQGPQLKLLVEAAMGLLTRPH